MLIRSYVQRKIPIRSSVRADQTVVLITDTNLRRCSLKDCWFSAVGIQYRVVVAVIIDLLYCLGHEYDHSNTENLEVELLCVEDFSVDKRGSLLLLVT